MKPIYKDGTRAERRTFRCSECDTCTEVHKTISQWRDLDIEFFGMPPKSPFQKQISAKQKKQNKACAKSAKRKKERKEQAEADLVSSTARQRILDIEAEFKAKDQESESP